MEIPGLLLERVDVQVGDVNVPGRPPREGRVRQELDGIHGRMVGKTRGYVALLEARKKCQLFELVGDVSEAQGGGPQGRLCRLSNTRRSRWKRPAHACRRC